MKERQFVSKTNRFIMTSAALALLAFTAAGAVRSTHADEGNRLNAQTAEIHLLLTAVHEVTSYNGNADTRSQHLAAWAQLWAEDATFTINNAVTYTGRDAIMTFFAGAGFFNNNWVGLSPTFRTEIAIHGDTAEINLECIFLNESKAIVLARALSGTVRKVDGQWLFWRMNNDPAAPLF